MLRLVFKLSLLLAKFAVFCAIPLVWTGSGAHAQGEVKAEYGNWNLHCETPVGASKEQCTLIQKVVSEQQSSVRLQVILLRAADNEAYIMRILVPLGVVLPPGLGLFVDGKDMGRVGFVRCIAEGCVAEVILPLGLIDQLTKGETATFTIHKSPEEGIGIPVSLEGFTDGFNALK